MKWPIRDAGGIIARDLVWLENHSFSAWGCSGCAWIIPTGPALSAKKSAPARTHGTTARTFLATSHQRTSVHSDAKQEFNLVSGPTKKAGGREGQTTGTPGL